MGVRNYRSGFNNQKSELGDVLPSQTFTVRQWIWEGALGSLREITLNT